MAESTEVEVSVDPECTRISVRGRLDVSTVADVRELMHTAVDHGTGDLHCDLTDLELVDATGLGLLLGTHRRAGRAGRRLVLHAVPPRVHRLLLATRLDRVLTLDAADVA
jgi:anti-anti-sigma factor